MTNLKVGDVFQGKECFRFGRHMIRDLKNVVKVSDDFKDRYETKVIKDYDPTTGKPNLVASLIEDAYNAARNESQFVVEEAKMTGGSHGNFNANNNYPDALHVLARRLNDDGTYNPEQEIVFFIQREAGAGYMETVGDLKVVRTMRKVVNFI